MFHFDWNGHKKLLHISNENSSGKDTFEILGKVFVMISKFPEEDI
jgi:hypothetical protein